MRITVKEAARIMECSEQAVRMLVQLNKIPGCCTYGSGKKNQHYYISKEAIEKFLKGESK